MVDIDQSVIIQKWKYNDISKPLVTVQCCTYNQEKFISDTLDGFLIQKTDFPFEVIVHDDASTDKTVEIIREYEKKYPLIIKPIYETENQYSKHDGSLSRIMNAASTGKYIAFCEGDDYWIDENKLQKQVDFLEIHPDYGLCYTKAKCYFQSKKRYKKTAIGFNVTGFDDLLINGNKIPTLTTVCRRSLKERYFSEIMPEQQKWLMGDYPMWLFFSHEAKVHFFEDVTACYRVLDNSASHSSSIEKRFAFEKGVYEIRKYYSYKYGVNIESFDDNKAMFLIYYSFLLEQYDCDISREMKICFDSIQKKTLKIVLIYFFSKNVVLFNLFCLARHFKT